MAQIMRVEGLKELESALLDLKTSTAKTIMRRNLIKAAQPMANRANQLSPDDKATTVSSLNESNVAATKQSKRLKKYFKGNSSTIEIYVGPEKSQVVKAIQQEFGNVNHGPQSFLRPAWDETKGDIPETLRDMAWVDIKKTVKRNTARQAKLMRSK
jgi:HK97 gp10 family phage protein